MLFFTGDEHNFHRKILIYQPNRPFADLEEMHEAFIANHNSVVKKGDRVVHAGDFSFGTPEQTQNIIKRLNGQHTFLLGCHDKWLHKSHQAVFRTRYKKEYIIVVTHFPARSWTGSFHGQSINLHAHSHGKLPPLYNQYDVGVDNNNFFPVSEEQIVEIIRNQNPALKEEFMRRKI